MVFFETLLSFLKILIPLLVLSISSIYIIRFSNIKADYFTKIIIVFFLNWSQIIISIEFLSLIKKVTLIGISVFHFTVLIILILLSSLKRSKLRLSSKSLIKPFRILKNHLKTLEINKVFKILIITWLVIILITTFFLGAVVPPKNFDSMTYHLARAAFWKQNMDIDHYHTRIFRQTESPINAEVGLLWLMIFSGSDNILFLIQWISLVFILMILYKCLRLINLSRVSSLLTSFFFSTSIIVILESYSTQNDMVAASFLVLTLFFCLKGLKEKGKFNYFIVLTGLSAGLAIGTKSYIILFIPGFLIFLLLFKNDLKKSNRWLKILGIIGFSIIGCFLFASYNWFANYRDFGSFFSSQRFIDLVTIENPGIKTFISNLTRHIASFYQLNDYDFGIISKPMEKIIYSIHEKINISISSPATTWHDQQFYISGLALNMDLAYFGPIISIITLPSIIVNFLIFIFNKKIRKNFKIRKTYLQSLKILVIPVTFFLSYVFIFKWHPWAGRYMISFVVLYIFSLAVFIDFIRLLNHKYLFKIIISILLLLSILFSGKALFDAWDPKLIPINGKSILSYDYNDRRYVDIPSPYFKELNEIADEVFEDYDRIGLITSSDDWDYIYFGDKLTRELVYIKDKDFKELDIKELQENYDLDGLIINRNFDFSVNDKEFNIKIKDVSYKEKNNYYFIESSE